MSFKIAIISLNQWALDFEGNTRRIVETIEQANSEGAIYRTGPELELCGYSLEDAFFENDTVHHSWLCLGQILDKTKSLPIIIDVGMPIHFGSLYNCRVICHHGRVLFIRAKTSLAIEGNYRESRHFNAWPSSAGLVPFRLPPSIRVEGQSEYVPFGADFVLDLVAGQGGNTLRIGWEVCQELWDIKNASAELYGKHGCHLVLNSSGSYWELRKLETIDDMIRGISLRAGACYAFANLFGCDGQRYVFSGRSCVYDRGQLKAMATVDSSLLGAESQMIVYEVVPTEIDEHRALSGIRVNRASGDEAKVWNLSSLELNASQVDSSYRVLQLDINPRRSASARYGAISPDRIKFQDEINIYVPLWLWDYLRRSGMRGFMMPLSGGLDSSTVAMLVFAMCNHLHARLSEGNSSVVEYFSRCHKLVADDIKQTLATPQDICRLVLKCTYLSTKYSSQETESRARKLCQSIGANFSVVSIQDIYNECRLKGSDGKEETPTDEVTLLHQNLQARLRMTLTYYLSGGNRIVLATGNVDEAIMGYLTKYDCSSADINPIGGLCKDDLKSYLRYCCSTLYANDPGLVSVLDEIIEAPPSAELTGAEQRDEDEIGITYDEISVLGKVRRGVYGCNGPRGAFRCVWRHRTRRPFSTKIRCLQDAKKDPRAVAPELAKIIKRFYMRYTRNRHKLTVLTPALHAETYSPDDNRFDHRQFLYPHLEQQFSCIDQMVASIEQNGDL